MKGQSPSGKPSPGDYRYAGARRIQCNAGDVVVCDGVQGLIEKGNGGLDYDDPKLVLNIRGSVVHTRMSQVKFVRRGLGFDPQPDPPQVHANPLYQPQLLNPLLYQVNPQLNPSQAQPQSHVQPQLQNPPAHANAVAKTSMRRKKATRNHFWLLTSADPRKRPFLERETCSNESLESFLAKKEASFRKGMEAELNFHCADDAVEAEHQAFNVETAVRYLKMEHIFEDDLRRSIFCATGNRNFYNVVGTQFDDRRPNSWVQLYGESVLELVHGVGEPSTEVLSMVFKLCYGRCCNTTCQSERVKRIVGAHIRFSKRPEDSDQFIVPLCSGCNVESGQTMNLAESTPVLQIHPLFDLNYRSLDAFSRKIVEMRDAIRKQREVDLVTKRREASFMARTAETNVVVENQGGNLPVLLFSLKNVSTCSFGHVYVVLRGLSLETFSHSIELCLTLKSNTWFVEGSFSRSNGTWIARFDFRRDETLFVKTKTSWDSRILSARTRKKVLLALWKKWTAKTAATFFNLRIRSRNLVIQFSQRDGIVQ
jgi:hypothetical protein